MQQHQPATFPAAIGLDGTGESVFLKGASKFAAPHPRDSVQRRLLEADCGAQTYYPLAQRVGCEVRYNQSQMTST